MTTRMAALALLILIGTLAPDGPGARAASSARLIATPSSGHASDPIYLSGAGFVPGNRVRLALSCSGLAPIVRMGPAANARGRFAAFDFPAPAIRAGHAIPCRFLASSMGTPPVWSHPYSIRPAFQTLPRCALHMCLTVQAFLVRLKNGAKGNIVVSGWPGARADVTVARAERGAKFRHLWLDWRGVGVYKPWVAPGLLKGLRARVFVRARLGTVSGRDVTSFHVMFGGR